MKKIGIKLADGSFYPILTEGEPDKKQINLTTAKDNQTTVHVDLYRSENDSMDNAEYVDTLQITHLVKHPNGEPDLCLDISLDEDNHLSAELHDPESGGESSTTVTLISKTKEELEGTSEVAAAAIDDSLNVDDIFANTDIDSDFTGTDFDSTESESTEDTTVAEEVPVDFDSTEFDTSALDDFSSDSSVSEDSTVADDNFSFDDTDFSDTDFSDTEIDTGTESEIESETAETGSAIDFSNLYDKETEEGISSTEEEIKKKTKIPVIVCIICAFICILAVLLILFVIPCPMNVVSKITGSKNKVETVEQVKEEPQPVVVEAAAEEPKVEAKENEIVVVTEPEVVQVVPEVKEIPAEKKADVRYKIKWGDTLWDISESYYKNPWQYKRIAKYNNIKNPDYIISGTYINIPQE